MLYFGPQEEEVWENAWLRASWIWADGRMGWHRAGLSSLILETFMRYLRQIGIRYVYPRMSHELRRLRRVFALQCWAINCKGNMHLLREALPTFNSNPEGGVFLMTSSIAVRLMLSCCL